MKWAAIFGTLMTAGLILAKLYVCAVVPNGEPSDDARRLIDSMLTGDGWRPSRTDSGLVHETAGIYIEDGWPSVNVAIWEPSTTIVNGVTYGKAARDLGFSYNDRLHIARRVQEARKNLDRLTLAARLDKLNGVGESQMKGGLLTWPPTNKIIVRK